MSDKNKMDVLVEGHEYDGIQEFNNPAPFWWQLFFYLSIVFGIGYFLYYQFLGGPTLDQELAEKLAKIKSMQAQTSSMGPTQEDLVAAMGVSTNLEVGKKVYIERCAACHLPDGGGLVGPNLVDNHWIHGGGTLAGIYKVINEGVGDKGMPPWGPILKQDELIAVSVYVKSLKGGVVANPKAPQGELVNE